MMSIKQQNNKKFIIAVITLIVFILLSIPSSLFLGSANITFSDTLKLLINKIAGLLGAEETVYELPIHVERIIWDLRLPRVLLGIAVGGGLSICGVAMQALTRNILAEPYILGVSSGASVMAVFVLMFGSTSALAAVGVSGAAFIGALLALVVVYALSTKNGIATSERLLLSGVAISMLLSSVTQFFVQVAPDTNNVKNALFWLSGSLAGARWDNVAVPLLVSLLGMVYLSVTANNLNLLSLGDESAVTLGLNVHSIRKILLVAVSLLTGTLVASSGGIGFVGLVIPHIVRLLVGSDHRKVLPLSFLLGAVFLIWADVLARILFSPKELSIGIITAFCGGPYFVWLLRRKK